MTLVAGWLLAPTASAEPTSVDPSYSCQYVTYLDILANKPVHGQTCTGPLGSFPGGSVFDQWSNTYYWCDYIEGLEYDGSVFAFGQVCQVN